MLRKALLALSLALATTAAAQAGTYRGPAVAIGPGAARVVVRTDAAHRPTAVIVLLTAAALRSSLPEREWTLAMPPGPRTGFDHVTIDWHPHGHIPPGIYTVPHFDFHFYTIDRKSQLAIAFPKQEKDPAAVVSDAALVPAGGYRVFAISATDQMGVHAVDLTSPEFHKKQFTTTFLYGYYENRMIFVEPMITSAFLESAPDVTLPLKVPQKYSSPGWYPTSYSIHYDRARQVYVIALRGLRRYR